MSDQQKLSDDQIDDLSRLITLTFRNYTDIKDIHERETSRVLNDLEKYSITLPVIIQDQAIKPVEMYVKELLKELNKDVVAVKLAIRPLYRQSKSQLNPVNPNDHLAFQKYLEESFDGFEPSLMANIIDILTDLIENLVGKLRELLGLTDAINFQNFNSFHEDFKLVAIIKGYHDVYHHIWEADKAIFTEVIPPKDKVSKRLSTKETYDGLLVDLEPLETASNELIRKPIFEELYNKCLKNLRNEIEFISDALSQTDIRDDDKPKIDQFHSSIQQALLLTNNALKECGDSLKDFNFQQAFGDLDDVALVPLLGRFEKFLIDELIVKQISLHDKWQNIIAYVSSCLDDLENSGPEELAFNGEKKWIFKTKESWNSIISLFADIETLQGAQFNIRLSSTIESAKDHYDVKDFDNFHGYLNYFKEEASPCFLILDNSLKEKYSEIAYQFSEVSLLGN